MPNGSWAEAGVGEFILEKENLDEINIILGLVRGGIIDVTRVSTTDSALIGRGEDVPSSSNCDIRNTLALNLFYSLFKKV